MSEGWEGIVERMTKANLRDEIAILTVRLQEANKKNALLLKEIKLLRTALTEALEGKENE
jgi:hypothetical protein